MPRPSTTRSIAWSSSRCHGRAIRHGRSTTPIAVHRSSRWSTPASGKLLYSRGYSTIFGEWRTTAQANGMQRSFQESLRFPMPAGPVRVTVYGRSALNAFVPQWSVQRGPGSDGRAARGCAGTRGHAHRDPHHGDPAHKVDLLLLGDGYTAGRDGQVRGRRTRRWPTSCSASRRSRNAPTTSTSGRWRSPVPGVRHQPSIDGRAPRHAATGARYDAFGSERYILTLDNRAFRELAAVRAVRVRRNHGQQRDLWRRRHLRPVQHRGRGQRVAPTTCSCTSSATTSRAWPTSTTPRRWPTRRRDATASSRGSPTSPRCSIRRKLKWKDQMQARTPVPTPWPKEAYEAYERGIQARRTGLRADNRPESEMSALFREEQAHVDALFAKAPYRDAVGAFQGANYSATAYYRPQLQCIMFTRAEHFARCAAMPSRTSSICTAPPIECRSKCRWSRPCVQSRRGHGGYGRLVIRPWSSATPRRWSQAAVLPQHRRPSMTQSSPGNAAGSAGRDSGVASGKKTGLHQPSDDNVPRTSSTTWTPPRAASRSKTICATSAAMAWRRLRRLDRP